MKDSIYSLKGLYLSTMGHHAILIKGDICLIMAHGFNCMYTSMANGPMYTSMDHASWLSVSATDYICETTILSISMEVCVAACVQEYIMAVVSFEL